MKIKALTYGLAAVFALIGPVLFLRNINLSDWGMLLAELGLSLWFVSPFILIALTVRYDSFPIVAKGALVATILAGLFGTWFYAELTFHFYNAKSGNHDVIAMLFIAAYQHAIIILTLGLFFSIGSFHARRK